MSLWTHISPGTWYLRVYAVSCIFLPEAYVQQYVIYVLVCMEFTADSVQLSTNGPTTAVNV